MENSRFHASGGRAGPACFILVDIGYHIYDEKTKVAVPEPTETWMCCQCMFCTIDELKE